MPSRLVCVLLFVAVVFVAVPAQAAPRGKSAPHRHAARLAVNDPSIPPHRIFALNKEGAAAPLSFEQLLAELGGADVVICGEYHDDPATHKMELALLKGSVSYENPDEMVIDGGLKLSMEMFERDVQSQLNSYLALDTPPNAKLSPISESEFLTTSRPWNNYATDYRPLVEFCKVQRRSVIAANAPTSLARRVAKEGWPALEASLDPAEKKWLAVTTTAPDDGYWELFKSFMGGGGVSSHGGGMTEEQIHRFYEAQCLKDDTMAESIENALGSPPEAWPLYSHSRSYWTRVFQLNGSFHSDYGYGVAQRVRQRLPRARVYTIALRPTPDFTLKSNGGSLDPQGETLADGTPVADFVVYVPAPPAKPEAK
jgi:uncharacterized iron-regulated protein